MKNNIGRYERLLRITFGIILITIGLKYWVSSYNSWIYLFIGFILVLTGFIGWCGFYSITRVSSRGIGLNKISKRDIENIIQKRKIKKLN